LIVVTLRAAWSGVQDYFSDPAACGWIQPDRGQPPA
jgi:hypothetical protein